MGFYDTIDEKILALYENASKFYQKVTGNTNYHFMRTIGYVGSASSAACGLEIMINSDYERTLSGVGFMVLAVATGGAIHAASHDLEKKMLENMEKETKDLAAEALSIRLRIVRLPLLLITIPSLILGAYFAFKEPFDGQALNKSFSAESLLLGFTAFFYGSALYFASCEPRKPQKRSLWEKVKALFSLPKVAEAISQYQAALYPFM